jgi:hypothetical protein
VQPAGRQGREFRREIRELATACRKSRRSRWRSHLNGDPEVATRERSDRAAEGFTAKRRARRAPSAAQRLPGRAATPPNRKAGRAPRPAPDSRTVRAHEEAPARLGGAGMRGLLLPSGLGTARQLSASSGGS